MKRFIFCLIGLIAVYSSVGAQKRPVLQKIIQNRLSRNADETKRPIPDYNQLYSWAASPHKHNCSDSIPSFFKNEIRDSSAEVFYFHLTTFITDIRTSAWKADLNDAVLNNQTDLRPILFQASVFNESCKRYQLKLI